MSETTKMDPELKAAWVAALRSGEYQQGSCQLKRECEGEAYYCCLGVLNEIGKFEAPGFSGLITNGGLVSRVPGLPTDEQQALAFWNDDRWTFDQIADYIEEKL